LLCTNLSAYVPEPGFSKEAFQFGLGEAQPPVAEFGRHPFLIVLAKVEHEQPAAGPEDASRFGERFVRRGGMVQRLRQQGDVYRAVA
jgi:hypothetical protein